jgi:AraC-like DNA-binding protein
MQVTSASKETPGTAEAAELGPVSVALIRLLQSAMSEVAQDSGHAKAYIAQASALLQVQIGREPADSGSGGLAAWQTHRVKAFIEQHLDEPIRVETLSEAVRLSAAYFSRAFKRSFGEAPHAYLMRRRLERARSFMLTTEMALSEIAAACGFSDQSHFCKIFRQSTGCSPAAWRRREKAFPH